MRSRDEKYQQKKSLKWLRFLDKDLNCDKISRAKDGQQQQKGGQHVLANEIFQQTQENYKKRKMESLEIKNITSEINDLISGFNNKENYQ